MPIVQALVVANQITIYCLNAAMLSNLFGLVSSRGKRITKYKMLVQWDEKPTVLPCHNLTQFIKYSSTLRWIKLHVYFMQASS